MIRSAISLSLFLIFSQCSPKKNEEASTELKPGLWRAVLTIQGQEVPFGLEIQRDSANSFDAYLLNAQERLLLDEVSFENDSVIIPLHIFDASIRAKADDHSLSGVFIKHYEKDYRLPFEARHGLDYRFSDNAPADNQKVFTGKYRVSFYEEKDTVDAVGIFEQQSSKVTGTFLTPTGDYRFLEGNVIGDSLHLSTFDGNYVYLFKAAFSSRDSLKGRFISGKTKNIAWAGVRDDNARLPDAEKLTFLKEGYDRINFSFPDVNGKKISPSDDKYRDKVVILQIFGTWCPNCLDETQFLSPWYDKNKDRGVEIIGLAYERKDDFSYASTRVKKMIEKLDVRYDFVIAGTNDKEKASASLPMLNRVAAFPTTIFIGKDGKVKKIHTGFAGPGTGIYYDQLVEEFNQTVNALLAERGNTADL